MDEQAVYRFDIHVPETVLDDLRARLAATRWPEPEPVDDWSQGVPSAYLRSLCRSWQHDYDWRATERLLNGLDQFTTSIDGLELHFLHQRSPHADAVPLILSHGWPSSVLEFRHVIGPLTDPCAHGSTSDQAFHVVAPSLPGFGFSAKPATTGWTVDRTASAFARLMERLGYRWFMAQGGDWGSAVTAAMGALHPEQCRGIHVTMAMGARPVEGDDSPQARRALERLAHYRRWDSGYSKQQSTRPQTIGYALTDSPVGQAAWIAEKYQAWTDCDGHPENAIGRNELLDTVTLYWITATAASSARLYWESFGRGPAHIVNVPSAVTVFPCEIIPPVRSWVEQTFTDLRHWSERERGGHFAPLEVPEVFVDELRAAAANLGLR
jgi:pimeloyl-ACP methyl ester carboxylesterase